MKQALLVLSALPEEARPLRRRAPPPVLVETTGDGAVRSARKARRLLDERSPSAVLFVGFAGALTPDLRRGEAVLARKVVSGSDARLAWSPHPDLLGAARELGVPTGTIVSTSTLVGTPEERRLLAARIRRDDDRDGPFLADLETAGYVAAAEERGVPWLALRVVSDEARESLPPGLVACQAAGGGVDRGKLLVRTALRPWEVPDLIRMALRARQLSRRMADVALPLLEAMTSSVDGAVHPAHANPTRRSA